MLVSDHKEKTNEDECIVLRELKTHFAFSSAPFSNGTFSSVLQNLYNSRQFLNV